MLSQWVPLSEQAHSHMKLKSGLCLEFYKSQHLLPVVLHELAKVAADFPVIFVKNAETGQFEMVGLVGVKSGHNAYVVDDRWRGISLPLVLASAPFSMRPVEGDDGFVLCVNEASSQFSAHEGDSLFEHGRKKSSLLERKAKLAMSFVESRIQTREYINYLLGNKLLIEQNMTITLDEGEDLVLEGIYLINDSAIKGLGDDLVLDARRRGYLTAIYAQMLSMQQMPRVVKLSMTNKND